MAGFGARKCLHLGEGRGNAIFALPEIGHNDYTAASSGDTRHVPSPQRRGEEHIATRRMPICCQPLLRPILSQPGRRCNRGYSGPDSSVVFGHMDRANVWTLDHRRRSSGCDRRKWVVYRHALMAVECGGTMTMVQSVLV